MTKPDVRTVTKKELVDMVAEHNGLSRVKAQAIVQDVLNSIVGVLRDGHRLELRDFGVFEVKNLAPRTAQNPRTLARVRVPARRSVRFKAGKGMRTEIDRGAPAHGPLPEPKAGAGGSSAGISGLTARDGRAALQHNNGQMPG